MKTKLILGLVLLFGLSIGAHAQGIRGKDRIQHQRIEQGKRGGGLTRGEAYRLHQQQRHLHQRYHRFKRNDGYLSRGERKILRHDQRRASRNIYRFKHNGNRRFD
jgi:hypothetical protein